jgi:SPP1 gp7 family putative phage head morphogenesis protein
VLSYLRSREEVVNNFLLPRLDRRDAGELVARHDLSGVDALKVDESEQLSVAATIATKSTGWSVNDVARMLGVQAELPEGGEVVLVDQSKITLEGLEEKEEMEAEASADEAVGEVPPGSEEHAEPSVSSEAEAAKGARRDKPCKSCDGLVTKDSPEPVRKQAEFQEPYEKEMAGAVEGWYGDVLAAQSKRLAAFARSGADALKHTSEKVLANGVRVVKVPDGEIDPSKLTLADLEDLLVDQEEWAVKLSELIAPVFGKTFTDTSGLWASLLGNDPFMPTDRSVIEYVRLNSVRLAEDLTGEVGRLVQERLLGVLRRAHGTNLMELQTAVREVLPAISEELQRVFGSVDARAQTIARTEVGKASSAAKYEEYRKANVERHVWISSRDEYVRPAGRPDMEPWSHVELDGQVRNVGDEFRTGLKFPLDPEADPRDRINCRCVTIPEVEA